MLNKKGDNMMVSYVLLIVIAVALSVGVYTFLKLRLPADRVECPADLALSIEEAECNRAGQYVALKLYNRGLWNVSGAFIRFGPEDKTVKAQINALKEYIRPENSPANSFGLPPGETTGIITNHFEDFQGSEDQDYTIEVQPAIFEKRVLVPCSNKIISQPVKCNSVTRSETLVQDGNASSCDISWDSSNPCANIFDGNWDTRAFALDSTQAHAYVNYSKPPGITDAVWEIKNGQGIFNLTIPNNCFASEPIQLQVISDTNAPGNSIFSCKDSSSWTTIQSYDGQPVVYEEAIIWQRRS